MGFTTIRKEILCFLLGHAFVCRRFFLSSVGIRVKTLSYEGFARVYFEFGMAEKDLSKPYVNKCLRFTPVSSHTLM